MVDLNTLALILVQIFNDEFNKKFPDYKETFIEKSFVMIKEYFYKNRVAIFPSTKSMICRGTLFEIDHDLEVLNLYNFTTKKKNSFIIELLLYEDYMKQCSDMNSNILPWYSNSIYVIDKIFKIKSIDINLLDSLDDIYKKSIIISLYNIISHFQFKHILDEKLQYYKEFTPFYKDENCVVILIKQSDLYKYNFKKNHEKVIYNLFDNYSSDVFTSEFIIDKHDKEDIDNIELWYKQFESKYNNLINKIYIKYANYYKVKEERISNKYIDDVLKIKIEELNFSVSTCHCLKMEGINKVEDLYKMALVGADEFMKIRNMSNKRFREIANKLKELKLVADTFGLD